MSEKNVYVPINLGQKRKLYNECVRYGIDTDTPIISEHIQGEDVEKLMKIDIACAKQDIDFVLNALTDEDMLYVSRTIKQSTWIVTNNKYAHIINPEYLESQLLPKMTAKAGLKLLKHIRLHLKDESRVEAFYNNETDIQKALKWLPKCSVTFAEQEVAKHANKIKNHLFIRLSEKSTSIWKILIKHKDTKYHNQAFRSTLFILYKDSNLFMDIIEEKESHDLPQLGVKGTEVVMKNNSQRVIDKLQVYLGIIDKPTFAKYLKAEEVKDVIHKMVEVCTRTNNISRYYGTYDIFNFDTLKCFIQQIPIEQRYSFVKEVFIDKIHANTTDEGASVDVERTKMAKLFSVCKPLIENDYVWYKFAPFTEAFALIKECIWKEPRQYERNSMLKTLLDFSGSNVIYRKEVLQYFNIKHLNDKLIHKENFICDFLSSKIPIYKYDESTWTILHEIFNSLGVYKESEDITHKIIEAIIVYNVTKNKKVPEVIENKFKFNSLQQYGIQMDDFEKDKIFNYLYNYTVEKYTSCIVEDEQKFKDKVDLLHDVLLILKHWKKNLVDYPNILDEIKECSKIKRENNDWKSDLSKLYNINKSWKKHMFEESIILNPSEEVCLNALKHDAGLLKRNISETLKLSRNDKISLGRLLSKLKIFWCHTLAKEWADEYASRLTQNDGSKALVSGLCAILPNDQIIDIIEQYAPEDSEINWEDTDIYKIALQRNIAKNMHTVRPQPPPDIILRYAKGDFLQYALPSVLAIFYNLNQLKTLEFIPKVFNAPVSLQKHGLRLAVTKIPYQDVITIFNSTWKRSKNMSIRSVIFKLTFTLLSKEKNEGKIKDLWELLSTKIDSLSFEEDSSVYELLGNVEEVPITVRAQFIERSYNFLKKMLPLTISDEIIKFQQLMKTNLVAAETIMDQMCPTLVTKLLLEYIEELNNKPVEQILHKNVKIDLLSTFLLTSSTEEEQIGKFNTLCKPFIKSSQKSGHKTFIPRLQFFLRKSLVKVLQKGMVLPESFYSQLHKELSTILTLSENYILLTEIKLFAALFKILKNIEKGDLKEKLIYAVCEFGKVSVTYLQEDIENHFPLIHCLFSKAISNVYTSFEAVEDPEKNIRNSFCRSLLHNKDCIPAHLVALSVYISTIPHNGIRVHQKSENKALLDDIIENKSVEVRMHYYANIYKI